MELVFRHLELIEREYFGLQFTETFHQSKTSLNSYSPTVYNVRVPMASVRESNQRIMIFVYRNGSTRARKFASRCASVRSPIC